MAEGLQRKSLIVWGYSALPENYCCPCWDWVCKLLISHRNHRIWLHGI